MNQLKIFFEVTSYCNYHCIYCFAPVTSKPKYDLLDLDIFKQIVIDLSSLKTNLSILLEGGEPLTVKNIFKYGKFAKLYAQKVALGTNASYVSKLDKKSILEIKNTFDEVSVGFDTSDPKLYKHLTRKSIEPAIQGIRILIKNKIQIKLCIVVTKNNLNFNEIVKFCENEKINKIRFYWFIPRTNNKHSLKPSDVDYERMLIEKSQYNGNIKDIKVCRFYEPYKNLVVSAKGEISISIDRERTEMKYIGKHTDFIKKLKYVMYDNKY